MTAQTAVGKHGGARVRFPPPLVYLVSTAIGIVLHLLVPVHVPLPALARWIAAGALGVAAITLTASAFRLFHRSGQDPAPWKPSPSLVLAGPYRFTRNPMYVGMTLMQVAIGLGANVVAIAILAAASLAAVHRAAVIPEEAYLAEKFGEDYERYLREVPRYL